MVLLQNHFGGVNVVISPTSKTIINLFDIEPETIKDEITGKERTIVSVENKVEDVTQGLLTMARRKYRKYRSKRAYQTNHLRSSFGGICRAWY